MNDLVKRGLEIMREPGREQGFGQLKDIAGNLCAIGCIAQAAVESGCAHWIGEGDDVCVVPLDVTDDTDIKYMLLPFCLEEAYWDLAKHGVPATKITNLNDSNEASLPEIADLIESFYAEDEVPA